MSKTISATWATPWDVTLNLGWQYLDGVDQIDTNVPATDLDSQNYFDLAGSWAVTDYASVRMGINNIFDERPPYVPQGVTARENGNTYPGTYPNPTSSRKSIVVRNSSKFGV